MLVDLDTYKNMDFTCKQCGWQGTGRALTQGEHNVEHQVGDLHCPGCNGVMAHWHGSALAGKTGINGKNKQPD